MHIQTSESSQKVNILGCTTKVESYGEIMLSFRLSETFDAFHTRITSRMTFPAKFSDCHSKAILSLRGVLDTALCD